MDPKVSKCFGSAAVAQGNKKIIIIPDTGLLENHGRLNCGQQLLVEGPEVGGRPTAAVPSQHPFFPNQISGV
jgi:hypothetical protein